MEVGAAVGDRDRRLPRRQERQGLRRRGRAHLRHQDRHPLRQARGRACRARRRVRLSQARRHRRRPRRRLARADRGPRPPRQAPASRCRSAGWRCRTSRRSRSRRPRRSSRKALGDAELLEGGKGRTFYAIGGTWRALARLHMWQTGYPLHVMHGYVMPAQRGLRFLRPRASGRSPRRCRRSRWSTDARRPLLAYAALVLENLVRHRASRRRS